MTDLISVIVPIYNVERYLDQALSSIENQTYRNLEILCVNDGSTDSSKAIIEQHSKLDSRIVLIDKENGGYGSGCNRGIAEAHGTWIAILEPDDWIMPTMYEEMIAYASRFTAHGETAPDIIKTPYIRLVNPDTTHEQHLNCSYFRRVKPHGQPFAIDKAPRLLRHHPSIWSALYRKGFLDENAIRFHEIPGAGWADNPFLLDTMLRAKRIVYLDKAFYCYREDTEERERNFACKTPNIPFERWLDMDDIVTQLDISDESILRIQDEKAFMYINGIERFNTSEIVQNYKAKIFDRMENERVLSNPQISPYNKQMFCDYKKIACPHGLKIPYYFAMGKEALYHVRNNGLAYTLGTIAKKK